MSLGDIAYCRIHPAIGIARVGNSEEYVIGPETLAGMPVKRHPCPGSASWSANSVIRSSECR